MKKMASCLFFALLKPSIRTLLFMSIVEKIVELFESRGDSQYGGESVTQLEHALQCATLAEEESANSELIVAALLHDIGHLVHELPDDAPDQGVDDVHETAAWQFLGSEFPDAVTEPIRLHVDAKRYLCATDKKYQAELSEPSLVSLKLQGGPMTAAEVIEFEQHPFFKDAIRLRYWDDTAKDPEFTTPSVSHFVNRMREAAGSGSA